MMNKEVNNSREHGGKSVLSLRRDRFKTFLSIASLCFGHFDDLHLFCAHFSDESRFLHPWIIHRNDPNKPADKKTREDASSKSPVKRTLGFHESASPSQKVRVL